MDNEGSSSFSALAGVVLIVAGIVVLFLSGFDPLIGALGVGISAGGAFLIHRSGALNAAASSTPEARPGERARQKPLSDAEKNTRIDRRL